MRSSVFDEPKAAYVLQRSSFNSTKDTISPFKSESPTFALLSCTLLPSLIKARVLTLSKDYIAAAEEFEHMQRTLHGADIKRRFDQVAYAESFFATF